LRDRVAQLSASELLGRAKGGTIGNAFLLTGIAAHDYYHAGQIQLLKRLSPPNAHETKRLAKAKPKEQSRRTASGRR
jgi:hypothetical protein